jgi:methionyl-tRNA formyltransferase
VVAVERRALVVACGEGCLALTELQRAGGRRMPAEALLRGWTPPPGAAFDAVPRPAGDGD